jgi:hypothetical protein
MHRALVHFWGQRKFVEAVANRPTPAGDGGTSGSPGRAHSYVSRIEKGDRRLDVPEFIQWCDVLDADPVEVLRRIVRR